MDHYSTLVFPDRTKSTHVHEIASGRFFLFKMASVLLKLLARYLIILSLCETAFSSTNNLHSSSTKSFQKERKDSDDKLSILFLHSNYPAHFFPLVALGAELVSRGHQVTTMGPTIEGYEHLPTLAESHGIKYISADFIPRWVYEMSTETGKHEGNANFLVFMYNMTQMLSNVSKDDLFLFKMKHHINKMNSSDYNYIISDGPVAPVLDYTQRIWNISNVMVVFTPIPFQPQYLIPWSFPRIISPFTDNMSFSDRFLNTVIFNPIERAAFLLVGFLSRIDESQPFLDYSASLIMQPVLINTVFGVDWPKTVLPLQHYVGPMLLQSSPSLDSNLVKWLSNQSPDSKIIYISMGTTGEVTDIMAKAFIELSKDYVLVWSLRESNHNVLKDLTINENRVYISSWISQFTMLQHSFVVLAIMHCGITSVQEALYNSIPVICFPNAYDQFDTALRLESQGLGIKLLAKKATIENVINAVNRIQTGSYNEQARKVSRLLKAGGGAKRGADLVELYADVGYDHGIPSFIRYKWSWIQYYNVDVWLVIVTSLFIFSWCFCNICGRCWKCCCSGHQKTKRD